MWKKGNRFTLLVRMETGAASMENSMEFPQKTKDGTEEYYSKGKKPSGKRQIPYDPIYRGNKMNKLTNKQIRTRGMETRNRLTAAGGQGQGGQGWKEAEGTSEGTCMNDPLT